MPRTDQVVLISRLKIHGKTLYEALSRVSRVSWVGRDYTHRMSALTFPYILIRELISLLRLHRSAPRPKSISVLVQFVSLDAIAAYIFRAFTGSRVILYAIGSDVLGDSNRIQRAFLGWTLRRADAVLCVNRSIQVRIAELWGVSSEILPTAFVEAESAAGFEKDFDLVTVGALTTVKRHRLLLESCAYFERPSRIALVGDGPLRKDLETLSKKYRDHEIVFFGELPHDQVYDVLRRSRMYVNCSEYEGVPSSVLEAMSQGLPVVAVRSGYVDDLIELYGFNLTIAEENTPASLASSIKDALNNYEYASSTCVTNKEALRKYQESWSLKALDLICKKRLEAESKQPISVLTEQGGSSM
ncbi:MAG: glycosyltransferase [Thaumarchaeota archaeon]|nr:glycosyltransferase [Nitrososphaerota archaeon]